jgi:high-affinity nickel-transport protein
MHDLATDWGALCALVFLLGMRHGLDPDHLAAIDGLTRHSSRQGRACARYCGALFSLGHGAVVLSIAALAGTLGAGWVPPSWFESLGSLISIGFLAFIGVVNLRAVLAADPHAVVPLVGLRGKAVSRLLARLGRTQGAVAVMGVGSLFALSFDTLSQSALFAVMAVQFGGIEHALVLGLLFVLGMLASDGANGWWISHLIGRADRLAVIASRAMTMAVACVSLLVAAIGIARLASREFEGWTEGRELAIGAAVIVLIGASYLAACRVAALRRPRAAGTCSPASIPRWRA